MNQAFAYVAWVQSNKNKTAMLALLDTLCSKQFTVLNNGGKTLVNTSVNGMSFSYSEGRALEPLDIVQMAIDVIREVKDLGQNEIEDAILNKSGSLTYSVFQNVL